MAQAKQNKIILVTGGAGFIGSHLCERLAKDKRNHVISLDNYFTGSEDNHIPGVEYRRGHTKNIAQHIPETPDIIYHLGEYSRVEQSILEPELVHDLNTLGTQAVVQFWQSKKCKLVYAGSSTKFGDGGATRIASPYARTKADNTELLCKVGKQESLNYAIAYFYNVYGPRERSGVYGTVIEHFKRMYVSGAPCAVVAPGTQVRNFTHVSDIVDALLLIGERGYGDGYGSGNEQAYSIFEVARMFGFTQDDIVLFPQRQGNRLTSPLNDKKTKILGWRAQCALSDYINAFTSKQARGKKQEKRVLVFSTTIHPIAGAAENALVDLASTLPSVQFDVITTRFTRKKNKVTFPANVTIYRVGVGAPIDKFLLPILGVFSARRCTSTHRYLFAWSLLASYATIAAVVFKRIQPLPLLVTLADHNLDEVPLRYRLLLRSAVSRADQVYGTHIMQETTATHAIGKKLPRNSLGEGDAFANALRYAYADILRHKQAKST